MYKYIAIIGLISLMGCATQQQVPVAVPSPSATATPTNHKITLNILSTDKAADGCSLSDENNGVVALGCKPGCVITFAAEGKVDRQCPKEASK